MQIQLQTLVPFIQSHPAEIAAGVVITTLVTTAVQRSSVLKNSPALRTAVSGAVGLTMGAGVSLAATQSDLAGKVLFIASAVAFLGYGYINWASRAGSTAEAAIRMPSAPVRADCAAIVGATDSAISNEPASFQELIFYKLISAISKCADADGLFRVPGRTVTINGLFEQLFPEQAVETPGKLKPSTVKKAKRAISSLRGKRAKASAAKPLSEADMKERIKALDANDLVGLFKKMLKECADFQHLLSDVQDDLTQVFSGAEQPTSDDIRALVMGEKFPAPKRGPLKAIIQMLVIVARENDQMGSDNLSTCMAPNFFMPGDDPIADVALVPTQNAAVAFMIEHCEEIFGSSPMVKAARS